MNDLISLTIGAGLAIIGGAIGNEIRAWRERVRERAAMKVTLVDELSDIESTIKNMHEVWEQSRVFASKYVSELLSSTSAYDHCRSRLFLIKDKELRKSTNSFYKKLKDTIKKSEDKAGTLADTEESRAEQAGIETAFQTLGTDAKYLREKLEKDRTIL